MHMGMWLLVHEEDIEYLPLLLSTLFFKGGIFTELEAHFLGEANWLANFHDFPVLPSQL